MTEPTGYCQRCQRFVYGRDRTTCPVCGSTLFPQPKEAAMEIPPDARCPYCYRTVVEHCSNGQCRWFVCNSCAAFGPQENFIRLVREETERAG